MAATIGVDCKSLIKQLIETITTDRESERLLLNLTPTTDGTCKAAFWLNKISRAASRVPLGCSALGDRCGADHAWKSQFTTTWAPPLASNSTNLRVLGCSGRICAPSPSRKVGRLGIFGLWA